MCRARRTVIRRTPARLTSRIGRYGRSPPGRSIAAVLGGEDQVMVRLLRPVLIGDLPFQRLQLRRSSRARAQNSGSGSTACEDSVCSTQRPDCRSARIKSPIRPRGPNGHAGPINGAQPRFERVLLCPSELHDTPASRRMGTRPRPWVMQGGTMRRTTIGALLTAALLRDPPRSPQKRRRRWWPRQPPCRPPRAKRRMTTTRTMTMGAGVLWGLAGLWVCSVSSLVGVRHTDTGTRRGTGTGGAHPNDRLWSQTPVRLSPG